MLGMVARLVYVRASFSCPASVVLKDMLQRVP
jgi:hypothetical protein